jgi:xanthine dehydrogenase accessory factor
MDSRLPRDIHQAVVELADAGRRFALAVVLADEGSTPCGAGAKAIVGEQGLLLGTIGGGVVEAEALRRASEALGSGTPVVFDFALKGGAAAAVAPICGGAMRVLVDPTAAAHRAAYAAAAAALRCRRPGVLITELRHTPGAEAKVKIDVEVAVRFRGEDALADDATLPPAESLRSILAGEQTVLLVCEAVGETPRCEVLVEPILPKPVLLIVGGGHVGQAVARQADAVGFEIVVIDDRPEFTAAELFPAATVTRCGAIDAEVARFPMAGDTYVVIVTRGHRQDAGALAACLGRPAAYLGMIGSRRKVALMREDMVGSGRFPAAEFDRVHAPIGLDLGAVTVPEIAVSIVSQLIAVRRRGSSRRICPGRPVEGRLP